MNFIIFYSIFFVLLNFTLMLISVPRGRKKTWPCKVGRDEKSLKSTALNQGSPNFFHGGPHCRYIKDPWAKVNSELVESNGQ